MGTVREFAERVLFGTSLDDKLRAPEGGLEDGARGPALVTPRAPGRPDGLRLSAGGVRADWPRGGRIEDDRTRGRLLHFFANHELLATELMALVLLKFPDAPDEFRQGVLRTLREEQMHTRLYLRRMRECGVAFGELPVNGFFWKVVAPMTTPLDYVTRLSLTFEQANLDYSRGFARVFADSGDAATARILERIYRDEIGHVHYGLEWFRRWAGGGSEWRTYCSLLDAPLSAARAKGGFAFNEEGRRAAGLDEEFIRELRVFERSKGRVPNVFWFNPEAEEELAGHADGAAAAVVARDLGLLMALAARREDVVVVEGMPSLALRESLRASGIELPELVSADQAGALRERKLGEARPWAATPRAVERARRLGLVLEATEPRLFSKLEQAGLMDELIRAGGYEPMTDESGRELRGASDLERLDFTRGPWVVKVPLSTAGRERMVLAEPPGADALRTLERWWSRGPLLAERWHRRLADFSLQFERGREGLVRRGSVVLDNSEQGQFRSARVRGGIFDHLPEPDRRVLLAGGRWAAWLEEVFEPQLDRWLGDYRGPLGVDGMVFRDDRGRPRVRPLVEVNPRWTMGRLAVELDRFRRGNGDSVLSVRPARWKPPAGAVRLNDEGARLAAWWHVERPAPSLTR